MSANTRLSEGGDPRLKELERHLADDAAGAIGQIRGFLLQNPLNASAYRLLATALEARSRLEVVSGLVGPVRPTDPRLEVAAQAIAAKDPQTAGTVVAPLLLERPRNVDGLCLMAEVASELNYDREAEDLLRLALEISPDSAAIRVELALLLDRSQRSSEAREELERVLVGEPENLFAKAAYAAALGRAGDYPAAIENYEQLLKSAPNEATLWTTYGYVLHTVGRTGDAVRAMRHATHLSPHNGEAWWSLANIKTVRFEPAEIGIMEAALDQEGLSEHDCSHIHFALGKAREDLAEAAEALAHYERANAIRRRSQPYDAAALEAEVTASIQLFDRQFFENRRAWGDPASDPIFIIGLPRSGSTLLEQILSSHPAIEGTKELLEIPRIAAELGHGRGGIYYETVAALDERQCRRLGEEYIERTRSVRTTGRDHFIDKLPDNWLHVPLISLILPNARIIDARRHPLACGFSNFKQNYTKGQTFSYDLESIGHYYRQYIRLLDHMDATVPRHVHRVFYEDVVRSPEHEIRRLLDYLGLAFDPACLRFHETERAVRSPSSGQVRKPMYNEAVDGWRAFEQWLEPLNQALGGLMDIYPHPPDLAE